MVKNGQVACKSTGMGEQIRMLRRLKGLTQQQLATALGVSRSAINRIENDPTVKISRPIIIKINSYLGSDLLNDSYIGSLMPETHISGQIQDGWQDTLEDLIAWFSYFARRYPELARELRIIGRRIVEAHEGGDEFLLSVAEDLWHEAYSVYSGIATGVIDIREISSIELWGRFLSVAKNTIIATSCINPSAWWLSTAGKYYQEMNIKMMREIEGLSTRRIFIWDNLQEAENSWEDILEPQIEAGIKICISLNLPKSLAADFYVIDESYVGVLHTRGREQIESSRFSTNKHDIARSIRQFNDLWNRCHEVNNKGNFKDVLSSHE